MSGYRRKADFDDDERAAKRRKGPEEFSEAERKLQEIISRVGDKNGNSTMESNLKSLYEVLERQENIDKYRGTIAEIVSVCITSMPEKISLYSTFVGLLNAKYFNFGGEMVEKLMADLQNKFESDNFNHALYIIIMLCDLGNSKVLTLNSIAEFLESLMQAAFEENVPQVRTDWFIFAVLHTLPWISQELNDKKSEELNNILEGCERYIEDRKRTHLQLIKVWDKGTPHEQEEYLDCLWAQIKTLKESDWKEKHITRHQVAFESILQTALQHNIPSFTAPLHKPETVYPLPKIIFRLFDYADCSDNGNDLVLPGAHSIERFLIEQELTWVLDNRSFDRKICAEELLLYGKGANVPIPYMILEVIFGQMFALPHHKQSAIYYGSLLIELCKQLPNEIPQVLAQAAELLYQRCDGMQPLCVDRLIDWFSYHLSNFQYRWSWNDWRDCLECDTWNAKFIFAREVLEKCMRFSYFERVCEIVPNDFQRLLPAKPDIRYLLEDETHPDYQQSLTFINLFQSKATDEIMLSEIKGTDGEYDSRTFGVFFSVLLKLACKTVSHNLAALRRYHTTLKDVADVSEEYQEVLLTTLYSCWKTNHQMIIILIDKLLKMQILDCAVVVNWIFSEDMKIETDRQWIFEVLNTALYGLSRHIRNVTRDVDYLKKKVNRSVRVKSEDADEEMVDEEQKTKDEEEFEAMNDKLESLRDFQKTLFLDVMQKFIVVLSEHIVNCEKDGSDYNTLYYDWMSGRLKQIFLMHYQEVRKFADDLGKELFTDAIDPVLLKTYQQFLALEE